MVLASSSLSSFLALKLLIPNLLPLKLSIYPLPTHSFPLCMLLDFTSSLSEVISAAVTNATHGVTSKLQDYSALSWRWRLMQIPEFIPCGSFCVISYGSRD